MTHISRHTDIFPRWPKWVWTVILALGVTQPLVHVLIAYFPPAGAVPTGLTIPDSAEFLYAMRMFPTHFQSHYATCQTPYGSHYVGYFPFTHLWPYGLLGLAAHWCGLDPFMTYGVATGLSAALYLAVVYAFLRQVMPAHADRAFFLFTLSGGLGGILYLLTGLFGLHDAPRFDAYFARYAMYELFEGPHLLPVTYLPRLYYTLSLALCLAALTLLIRCATGELRPARIALAAGLMILGTAINARSGIFTGGVGLIYLGCRRDCPLRHRVALASSFIPAFVVAAILTRTLLSLNPRLASNLLHVANMAVWFSPLLSVVALHLFLVPREVAARLPGLSPFARLCAWAAVGYLGAFTVLFVLYQGYYGNLLVCRDAAVAERISDWGLLGAGLGALWAARQGRRRAAPSEHDWVVLWLLAYGALAISAFGQGWFLRFGPHRLQVLLWLPVCMLSALGLDRWRRTRPRAALTLTVALGVCGVSSIFAGVAFFEAAVGRTNARGPYPQLHTSVMSLADAHVLDKLGEGRVLAPSPGGDVVVFTRGNPVVYGIGSFNMAEEPEIVLRDEVARFFDAETPDAERLRIVQKWCADYVYCPDTWPVSEETMARLRRTPWLDEAAAEGRGALFRVNLDITAGRNPSAAEADQAR